MRLPNVVVATLTRRSALCAMQKGIGASLIAHFLQSRVHPAVAAQVSYNKNADSCFTEVGIRSCRGLTLPYQGLGVPENVIDQLYLWEQEQRCG